MSVTFRVNGNKNIEHDKIKAKLGYTSKYDHSVFYLEGGVFITPKSEVEDFDDVMQNIQSSCRKIIKSKLLKSKSLDTNFLINFEVCSDRMKKDKRTYLSFQYHFKQKNNNNESIFTVKNENKQFFNDLLNNIQSELESYNINLSKKRKN